MRNPLSLLPLAIAAGNGRITSASTGDSFEAQQLIAAGFTLLQRCAPLVRALNGKRGAILLPTAPAYFTALAANEGRGTVCVNPLAAAPEVAYQCADANVGALFTNSSLAPKAPPGVPLVILDDAPYRARVIVDSRAFDVDLGSHFGLSIEGEIAEPGSDDECAIVYTSAMRGQSLGAILTHRNLLANAKSVTAALGTKQSDHVLALLPYAHLFGLTVTGSAPLILGAHVTAVDRFHPGKAVDLIANGVTQLVGVPAVYFALLAAIEKRGLDLRQTAVTLSICGGAVLPAELQERWAEVTGLELREGYGLTEGGPVALVNRPDRPNVRGTMGIALPEMEVRILDAATGAFKPDGEAGEICVKGENVSPGYVNGAHGLTLRDGWLYTGDIGVRHADGSIRFLGLSKRMFTRNGFNVYPAELERVLKQLPGVETVLCHGVPDRYKENNVAVRIQGAVTEAQVRAFCEERLSAYKQPSIIEIAA